MIYFPARELAYSAKLRTRIRGKIVLSVPRRAVNVKFPVSFSDHGFIVVYHDCALAQNFTPKRRVCRFSRSTRRCKKICFSVHGDCRCMKQKPVVIGKYLFAKFSVNRQTFQITVVKFRRVFLFRRNIPFGRYDIKISFFVRTIFRTKSMRIGIHRLQKERQTCNLILSCHTYLF